MATALLIVCSILVGFSMGYCWDFDHKTPPCSPDEKKQDDAVAECKQILKMPDNETNY